VLFTAIVIGGFAVDPYVGAGVLVAVIALTYWGGSSVGRNWSPNVHGENAYQILGVDQRADAATIRQAFRRLEQEHHPDSVPEARKSEATSIFIRIGQAYELLSDQEKRFQYDGLIEDLEGGIPPFDETYLKLKDEDKHPIYEDYDLLYAPRRRYSDDDEADATSPVGHKIPDVESSEWIDSPPALAEDRARISPEPEKPMAQGQPVTDVVMPASIREALGLTEDPVPIQNDGGLKQSE